MQTYKTATEEKTAKVQSQTEDKLEGNIPNSVFVAAMSAADAVPSSSPSDPNLLANIKSRRQLYVPQQLSDNISNRLGVDLGGTKVYETPNLESTIGEQAVTRGSEIFVQEGHFNPSTQAGQNMLTHEMTHVAQQGLGMVSGSGAVSSPSLEAAADAGTLGEVQTTAAASFSMPVSGASAPVQGLSGFKKFLNWFSKSGREENKRDKAEKTLARKGDITPEKLEYMQQFGYSGSSTLMATPETEEAYDRDVSPKTGGTFSQFAREITGGDNRVQQGEAGRRELRFYEQDLTDRLLAGDKGAYVEMILKYNAGIEKFVQTDWVGMSDKELMKNYSKFHAFSRHAISQKQLFEKANKLMSDVFAEIPGGEQRFEDNAMYIEALSAHINNRMTAMASKKDTDEYRGAKGLAEGSVDFVAEYRGKVLERIKQNSEIQEEQQMETQMEDVPNPQPDPEAEAKGRRADTMRAAVATFNARASSLTKAMGQNLTAKGVQPTDANTSPGLLTRSAQAMMIPGNESYNQKVAAFFSDGKFGDGATTMGANKNDPQKMQKYRDLMKPHVDFFMNADFDSININDPESLRAHMPLLARAGIVGQYINDAVSEFPDIAGSVERSKELTSRVHFANNAFAIARAQVAKEQGYKNDESLYSATDYSKAVSTDVESGLANEQDATQEQKTQKKYRPDDMQRNMERLSKAASDYTLGAATYKEFLKRKKKKLKQNAKEEKRWQKRQAKKK